MAVIYTPHFMQFLDDNGSPLSGGKLYTYAAGTTTLKATYTTEDASIENTNPIVLDSSGRTVLFISGSYKFALYGSDDVLIRTTDNITSFTSTGDAADSFFESFSGTGAQTVFTVSEDLGTDEKLLMVFVDAGGGEGFNIQPPSAYTIDGTSLTFGAAPASGTNNIQVWAPSKLAAAASASAAAAAASESAAAVSAAAAAADAVLTAADVISTNADVLLTNADVVSTNADVVSTNADVVTTAASAAEAESAVAAAAIPWEFDASTTMGDPTSGKIRLNNAIPASVTQIAVSANSDATGNPDVSDFVATWDDSTNTNKGTVNIVNGDGPDKFATYTVTGVTDNTTWLQIAVTYVDGASTFSASDKLYNAFSRSGNKGADGAGIVDSVVSGDAITVDTTDASNPITNLDINKEADTVITASDEIVFADITDSNAIKKDTVQGIIDLVEGGDVVGPASATDSAVAQYNGTTGKLLKDGPEIGTSANNLVQLNGSAELPAVDGSNLTNISVDALSTASGSAPSYSLRAWGRFNGTGTPSFTGDGNFGSITDNGTGDYTLNFTTSMPSSVYATLNGGGTAASSLMALNAVPSTSAVRIAHKTPSSFADGDYLSVGVVV